MDEVKRSLRNVLWIEGILILSMGLKIYGDLPPEDRYKVLWSFFVGILLLTGGVIVSKQKWISDGLIVGLQKVGAWLDVSPVQVVLLMMAPAFAVLATNAAGFWIRMRSPYLAVAAWLIGIASAIWGAWKRSEEKPRVSYETIGWFVVLTLAAFLFRGIVTDEIPILLTGDEASAGLNAIRFVRGEWNNIFITGWFSFPSLYPFLQSLGIRALGISVEALRIPSAVAGALTVGAVYLSGKAMFGKTAGIFAALILASSHYHIHFSRLGLNNIWDGFWFSVTIGLFWYGWKTNLRWAYLLAGLSLGLSQYFYASSKALIAVLLTSALLGYFLQREKFRRGWTGLAAAFAVALAVSLPLVCYYVAVPNALVAPFARVSMLAEIGASNATFRGFLLEQLPNSFGAYTHVKLAEWYEPEAAILRPLGALFFLLGLILLTFREKGSRAVLLGLWLLAFAFVNALSSYSIAAQRYVAAVPACALVAGYGLDRFAAWLTTNWQPRKRFVHVISYMILIVIMSSDLFFYFVDYTSESQVVEVNSNGMAAYQVGSYLKYQPPETQVIVFGDPRMSPDSPALQYLAPQVHRVNGLQDWETFQTAELPSSPIVFVFLPEYRDRIVPVMEKFPGGVLIAQNTWSGSVLFWVYEYNSG